MTTFKPTTDHIFLYTLLDVKTKKNIKIVVDSLGIDLCKRLLKETFAFDDHDCQIAAEVGLYMVPDFSNKVLYPDTDW